MLALLVSSLGHDFFEDPLVGRPCHRCATRTRGRLRGQDAAKSLAAICCYPCAFEAALAEARTVRANTDVTQLAPSKASSPRVPFGRAGSFRLQFSRRPGPREVVEAA